MPIKPMENVGRRDIRRSGPLLCVPDGVLVEVNLFVDIYGNRTMVRDERLSPVQTNNWDAQPKRLGLLGHPLFLVSMHTSATPNPLNNSWPAEIPYTLNVDPRFPPLKSSGLRPHCPAPHGVVPRGVSLHTEIREVRIFSIGIVG